MNNNKNILWGIVLVIIGVIVGLNALNITNIDIFFNGWWTLFIIIPSLIGLLNAKDKTGNIIGLTIGIVLLLGVQNIINFDLIWKLILPMIIIIFGLSLIFGNTFNNKINKEIKKINNKKGKNEEYCSTFSQQKIDFDDEDFKGTSLTAVFGGIALDLRKAKINEDVVINTTSVFGGIDIYVPDNIKIKVKSTSIFGGVDNKKIKNDSEKEHIVYINASCIFGGVDIK
ncbi:MAG: LiaF transmembrane domain-containing protein [Bacilli bacterium]